MNALVAVNPAMPVFGMDDIKQIALAIANGGLFGSKDPSAVLTLCLLAQAEGQHPAVVFRDYHIIQGKPAKKADAMLRDFINSGGKVEWHTLTDEAADATFSHPSGSARIDWTLERAKTAGITNPMWKKYPRQMLRSRVISEGVRTVYPGATSGLYEVNEVHDIVAETVPQGEVVENEPVEKPKRGLDGPHTSKKALYAAYNTLQADVIRCGDADSLDCLLATAESIETIAQCERDAPHYLHGGDDVPEDFEPLFTRIQRMRDEFALEPAQ